MVMRGAHNDEYTKLYNASKAIVERPSGRYHLPVLVVRDGVADALTRPREINASTKICPCYLRADSPPSPPYVSVRSVGGRSHPDASDSDNTSSVAIQRPCARRTQRRCDVRAHSATAR
ncbi:hypothetical protein BaRGS_00006976, partial [Batillaria attramentaria]